MQKLICDEVVKSGILQSNLCTSNVKFSLMLPPFRHYFTGNGKVSFILAI